MAEWRIAKVIGQDAAINQRVPLAADCVVAPRIGQVGEVQEPTLRVDEVGSRRLKSNRLQRRFFSHGQVDWQCSPSYECPHSEEVSDTGRAISFSITQKCHHHQFQVKPLLQRPTVHATPMHGGREIHQSGATSPQCQCCQSKAGQQKARRFGHRRKAS